MTSRYPLPDFSNDLFGELKKISDEDLDKRTRLHEQWLSTVGKEGQQLKLFRYDLSGRQFNNRNLSKASFELCDLRNTQTQTCQFEKSKFYRSCLDNSKHITSNFNKSCFISVFSRMATFKSSSIESAIFMYSFFEENRFEKCQISNANFENCSLEHTTFSKCVLDDAFIPASNRTGKTYKNCTASEKSRFKGDVILSETSSDRKLVWTNGKFDPKKTAIENGFAEEQNDQSASSQSKLSLGAWTSKRCAYWRTLEGDKEKQRQFYDWVEEEKERGVPHQTELPNDF